MSWRMDLFDETIIGIQWYNKMGVLDKKVYYYQLINETSKIPGDLLNKEFGCNHYTGAGTKFKVTTMEPVFKQGNTKQRIEARRSFNKLSKALVIKSDCTADVVKRTITFKEKGE